MRRNPGRKKKYDNKEILNNLKEIQIKKEQNQFLNKLSEEKEKQNII